MKYTLSLLGSLYLTFFLVGCQSWKNEVECFVYSPINNGVVSNSDSVLIDFEISASIELHPIQIHILSDSIQNDYVYSLEVIPQGNSYRYTDYVNLSSYSRGRKFELGIVTKSYKEKSNGRQRHFFKRIEFEL